MKNKQKKNKEKKAMRFRGEFSANDYANEAAQIPMLDRTHHAITLGGQNAAIALDNALPANYSSLVNSCYQNFSTFLGYPFLQQIAQNPLVSAGVETVADEMTKKFIKIEHNGEDNKAGELAPEDKIKALESDIKRFEIKEVFHEAAQKIGYYGGCLVFIDTGLRGDDESLLDTPLYLDPVTLKVGDIKGFVVIDPINCYPSYYNSIDPTKKDYFKPNVWNVLGKDIHITRLLHFSGQEAPLLLKPSYNFFGISSSQLAWDYIEDFNSNRQSVSQLLDNFSTTILSTNMSGALQGEGMETIDKRADAIIKRRNSGVLFIDKEEENFFKSDSSISGVTEISRQGLELIATVFKIPAVKFLGISPSGFNATGESDMRNYYDHIESLQQKELAKNMQRVLEILQLNAFGSIDSDLVGEWIPLSEKDSQIKANTEKTQADTVAIYLDRGIVSEKEARTVLAKDKEGMFTFIEADVVPEDNLEELIPEVDDIGAQYG